MAKINLILASSLILYIKVFLTNLFFNRQSQWNRGPPNGCRHLWNSNWNSCSADYLTSGVRDYITKEGYVINVILTLTGSYTAFPPLNKHDLLVVTVSYLYMRKKKQHKVRIKTNTSLY